MLVDFRGHLFENLIKFAIYTIVYLFVKNIYNVIEKYTNCSLRSPAVARRIQYLFGKWVVTKMTGTHALSTQCTDQRKAGGFIKSL